MINTILIAWNGIKHDETSIAAGISLTLLVIMRLIHLLQLVARMKFRITVEYVTIHETIDSISLYTKLPK